MYGKLARCAHLDSSFFFVPFAMEISVMLGDSVGERVSIGMQRGNAAAILGTNWKPTAGELAVLLHGPCGFIIDKLIYIFQ